jgi:PAS domain S-box-containing protein
VSDPGEPRTSTPSPDPGARALRILDRSLNEIYVFSPDDLRFEYLNHGALRNLGYTLDEARALTPLDLKPEYTRDSFAALVAPLLAGTLDVQVFETVHRRKDGTTYPVEVHLRLVEDGGARSFVAIINDLTARHAADAARRAAEQERRAADARFRALIEQSLDLLLLSDERGRFVFASPSSERVLGYTPEELRALSPIDLVHPDDRAAAAAAFARTQRGEPGGPDASGGRVEFRVRAKDGAYRILSAHAQNLLHDPLIGAFVLNARDVTEERRLEQRLRQAERLESIGRLAGGVAHDFNNILTALFGGLSFLAEATEPDPALHAEVVDLQRAAQRAADLTQQLLAFARRSVLRPTSLDLAAVLADGERFLRRVLGEHIALSTLAPRDLWPIRVDRSQLDQVILNLTVNARDAMGARGGRLELEASNVWLDESFARAHAGAVPGPYVLLAVSDTGEGIPPEVLPHIFEPFVTTKANGEGTGLGLATVYGIVRQSGGYVSVYSEVGRGTTFRVYFPRAEGATEAERDRISGVPTPGTGRVLVVDDDEGVRRMMQRTLERAGYAVHAAASPAEALAWLRASASPLDLLVTDVVLPGMNGRELADRVRADRPALRVLYTSGYTANVVVHDGVLESGVELLSKPFSPAALSARVAELLSRSS